MLYPFKFNPVFKDYIWGGNNLKKLGKNTPEGITAESWEISCHPDGESTVANGVFKGIKLHDLVKTLGNLIVGNIGAGSQSAGFPLLFKLIDANQKLSVQVHPDDSYAEK
jgi:mannose-6-phosphate isomerase